MEHRAILMRRARQGVLALGVAGTLTMFACDGGGGGSEGGATIRGVVASFDGQQAFYLPAPARNTFVQFSSGVLDLIVPATEAAVAGVTVSVAGTDLSSTTAADGFFVVSGVAAGARQLIFALGGESGTLDLDVPVRSQIDLGDVSVGGGRARPSKIEVTQSPDDGNSSEDDDSSRDGFSDEGDDDGGNSGPGGEDPESADGGSGSGSGDGEEGGDGESEGKSGSGGDGDSADEEDED